MQLLDIPGIGEKIKDTLERAGISTPEQLLTYYPRTHRYYHKTTIQDARVGDWVILTATLSQPFSHHTGRVSTQQCRASDLTGNLTLRWFNSPFIVRSIKAGASYQVLGRIESFANKLHLVNPTLKLIGETSVVPDTLILPIYTPLGNLKSGNLRNLIQSTLETIRLSDPLTANILAANHLYPRQDALKNIHFPTDVEALKGAIHRLGFDELVALQSESLVLKEHMSPPTEPLLGEESTLKQWLKTIPFALTPSQQAAITTITQDLALPQAMHRLVIGDVGSGKTLVAAASILWTILSKKRALILAPTQILAEQLYKVLSRDLSTHARTSLITSAQKGTTEADVLVGTHALLSPKHRFDNIGLVVIDEQHRFGVKDREALRRLTPTPHLLMMSATPIPRTLAMTTLAHLDITTMTDLPAGRLPVKSYVVSPSKRADAYNWLRTEIERNNQQAFIVTPLIEQAENDESSPKVALKSLEQELKTAFPHLKIDYVHGKMKPAEKTAQLEQFRSGKLQILVATSMIEVGIDLPNTNLILIENAELFGLATLHQLRGRVGRGGGQGHCLLVTHKQDPKTLERLSYFVREKSGAQLAEYDLARRGPGEIFGTLQSGSVGLRFASLTDTKLIESTRQVAATLAQNGPNTYNTPI